MLKVMTLVGTRPELIKMSRVIAEFDRHSKHILVHTGQNFDYELNQVFFDDLGIRKPEYFLGVTAGGGAAQTIAKIIEKADEVFEQEKPDALLIYGDTNSGLAIIAAKRRKIPIFHMEAGNRCFDQRVPEEINRKIIDHLSDINLVLTEHARRCLIAEGIRPETIIKTGSHMQEVLAHFMPKIKSSNILDKLGMKSKNYFLISAHREENVDNAVNLEHFLQTLEKIATLYQKPIIVSTHPRTRQRLEAMDKQNLNPLIQFLKPFGFLDYIKLQLEAYCILSDSGTITEEASLLNLPAINLRNAHERPEGMDSGVLIMSGLKADKVLHAIEITVSNNDYSTTKDKLVTDYQGNIVSKKVLQIVYSYTDYVNRTVWFK